MAVRGLASLLDAQGVGVFSFPGLPWLRGDGGRASPRPGGDSWGQTSVTVRNMFQLAKYAYLNWRVEKP